MRGPFESLSETVSFALVLTVVLTLPVILYALGGVTQEQVYAGIPLSAAPSNYLRKQIFQEHSGLDIVFAGSSLMKAAIDVPSVRDDLTQTLGRPAGVKLIAQSWEGVDMVYMEIRDLLEHRPVKMLVFGLPRVLGMRMLSELQSSNRPHVQLFRLARWGSYPGAFDGLSLRYRLAVYADFVLGAPRNALSLLRANIPGTRDADWDSDVNLVGNNGKPFMPHEVPPGMAPPALQFSPATQARFQFDADPLSEYQYHFLRKVVELARQHGTTLVFLHIPHPAERNQDAIHERHGTAELLGNGVLFAGVPFDSLFRGIPPGQVDDFYRDDHFNRNGQLLFTQSVTPLLRRIYETQTSH